MFLCHFHNTICWYHNAATKEMIITHTIDIVVPCYNEAEGLNVFYEETSKILNQIKDYSFSYIFIDDGSKDTTLNIIKDLATGHENVKFVSFSRNFGKEAGMYAGLKYSSGDYVIIMDAEGPHP